jgi:hypothetical protein
MKKIYTLLAASFLAISFTFVTPEPAQAQIVPVTKKAVKNSYRAGKRGVRAGYRGGRWVTIRVYRGGKWVTKKVWRGGKRVVMGKRQRRP